MVPVERSKFGLNELLGAIDRRYPVGELELLELMQVCQTIRPARPGRCVRVHVDMESTRRLLLGMNAQLSRRHEPDAFTG